MALTYPIDVSTPAGSDDPKQGDDRIREFKNGVVEIVGVDHDVTKTGDVVNGVDAGKHKQISLIEKADIGTGASGKPILGAQTVDGKPELVYTDEDDNDVQLTNAGKINVADSDLPDTLVKLTGDQTVAGVKTFSDFPVTPSEAPDADYEVANKKYADDLAAAFDITDHIAILTGTVANGGTIPLPDGYTEEQCKWTVGVGNLSFSNWDSEATGGWVCQAYCTGRVVTLAFGRSGTPGTGGTANYMIIGIK